MDNKALNTMYIDNLIIEITRRCNMTCAHCLRGNAQKRDFPSGLFEEFIKLNNIDSIGNLSITGGEPFLNPTGIAEIFYFLYNHKIDVSSLYIATNGTVFDYSLVQPLSLMKEKINDCNEEYGFQIDISVDQYHKTKLKRHPFFHLINAKERTVFKDTPPLHEGRAVKLSLAGRMIENNSWIIEDDNICECEIYINCKGNICMSCDYAYRTQEKRHIGHCLSKKLLDFKHPDIIFKDK